MHSFSPFHPPIKAVISWCNHSLHFEMQCYRLAWIFMKSLCRHFTGSMSIGINTGVILNVNIAHSFLRTTEFSFVSLSQSQLLSTCLCSHNFKSLLQKQEHGRKSSDCAKWEQTYLLEMKEHSNAGFGQGKNRTFCGNFVDVAIMDLCEPSVSRTLGPTLPFLTLKYYRNTLHYETHR